MTQQRRILLAIPTGGGLDHQTSAVAARLSQRADVEFVVAQGRPVDYVRNGIVRQMLEHPQFTHLFLLDSDVEPPLDCIDRLLALDAPIATGCYAVHMHGGLRWALARRGEDGHYRLLGRLDSQDTPFAVDAGGAGCLLIKRGVLEAMAWPWFRWVENEDGSQISEDIWFFDRARQCGYSVTVEPTVICRHYKRFNVTGLLEMVERAHEKGAELCGSA